MGTVINNMDEKCLSINHLGRGQKTEIPVADDLGGLQLQEPKWLGIIFWARARCSIQIDEAYTFGLFLSPRRALLLVHTFCAAIDCTWATGLSLPLPFSTSHTLLLSTSVDGGFD